MFQDIYYARDILYERLWIAEARFSPKGGTMGKCLCWITAIGKGRISLGRVLFFNTLLSIGCTLFFFFFFFQLASSSSDI